MDGKVPFTIFGFCKTDDNTTGFDINGVDVFFYKVGRMAQEIGAYALPTVVTHCLFVSSCAVVKEGEHVPGHR